MTRAHESLKHFHFNGLLFSKVQIVWAKKYSGIAFHETEEGYKTWGGIDLSFQNWQKIWQILTWAPKESLKNFHFNGLLLSKVYIVWAAKVQRNYLSWHRGVMQILKKDSPVVWKKTWEIWQIFTRALENVKIGTLISHQTGIFVQSRKGMTLKFTEE